MTTTRHRDTVDVLAGRSAYDDLGLRDQAVVRVAWDERVTEAREGLDLAADFTADGTTGWVEIDDEPGGEQSA